MPKQQVPVFVRRPLKTQQKVLAVLLVRKNLPSLDASSNYMMQAPGTSILFPLGKYMPYHIQGFDPI
ncbi:MAG: hypothetical protein C4530_18510 [Desulfobacteraceae bacterium]|nr:MAG: hypothetical protein C4530_18510 [Desulfobacteraceae bacterium]